jgi:hypothetical protein
MKELRMPSDYDEITAEIKALTRQMDAEAAAFTVLNCVASVTDELTGGHSDLILTAGQKIYQKIKGSGKKSGPVPNPWFVFNGQEDRDNKFTKQYKKSRTLKKVGGSVSSVVGSVASVKTGGINVASTIMHANATGTTAAHMYKIIAIANSYPQSKTIAAWCNLILQVKTAKATIRGGQLIGGLVPGAHLPAAILAAIAKTGVKLTYTNAVYAAAANIHWRAFQEQAISGGRGMGTGGKIGPGSQIYWEIFTKRGMTALLGRYEIAQLVQEPGGWEPLADKLLLI